MIIQHNIAAINSYRNLGVNQSGLNKNLEKLSSGYKINRAGDDAAGLAISESMRSQINGLNQAAKNAQDAIGLIQTAEGALTEVHSMLQRLTTLASQSANGTYNTVARGNLQSEVDELLKEIDRIANNTDFNGIKPLANEGSAGKMTFQIGPSGKETIVVNSQAMTVSGIQAAIWDSMQGFDRDKFAKDATYYTNHASELKDIKYEFDKAADRTDVKKPATATVENAATGFIGADGKVSQAYKDAIEADSSDVTVGNVTGQTAGFNNVKFNSKSSAMSALLPTLNISGSSTVVANAAIDTINSAINAVSSYRAKLGAAQNRLEHTVNNLKVTAENITSAESRIRDTDMADEITAFTKNNILLQASQSMLAQSNSVPQSILSLLQ
ncbi:MAG: flagellar hook associated protein [Lachnospiraceae bacterium]|nr:flagellar hook associated protein [Lachnospiraceae bacterium]